MNINSKFQNLINNLCISKKLLLMYACTSLIPLFVICIYFSFQNNNLSIERNNNQAIYSINKLSDDFLRLIELNNFASSTIYLDDNFKDIATKEYSSFEEFLNEYNINTISDNLLKYYKDLKYINFYVENNTILNNKYFIKVDETIKKLDWYTDATKKNSYPKWYYKKNSFNDYYNLCLISPVKDKYGKQIGVLDIGLKEESLSQILKNISSTSFITLDDIVLISNDKTIYSTKFDLSSFVLKETKDDILIYNGLLNNEKVQLIKKTLVPPMSSSSEFNLYIAINLSQISKENLFFTYENIYIILVSLLISTILILIFTKLFNERFSILTKEMNKVSRGEFDIKKSLAGKDEVAEVYGNLVKMSSNLEKLINEIYVADLNKEKMIRYQKEIEFKMLCSQINPHFLYNTLETIRVRSYINGDKESANLIKILGKLMRYNLEVSSSLVTLESELDLINNYLTIQKYRFEDHISFDINVDCDSKNIMILPMLIQPIVENAFVHGLEKKLGPGELNIKIIVKHSNLIIIIEDNGLGISDDKLVSIYRKFNECEECDSNHIGITNVYKRIKLFYGENYGIDIKNNEKTTVTLTLKAINKED